MSFDAFWLPGLESSELLLADREFGEVAARVPQLAGAQLQQVIAHIAAARAQLQQIPVSNIVHAIDAVAARIAAPDTTEGMAARALLPACTGFSRETIEDVLTHMTADWSRASLELMLRSELGNAAVLDAPAVHAPTGRTLFASGPRLAYHVFSGNVPGVAVTSIIRSLLVKGATLGKTASGEPVLPVIFARALADVAPDIAQALAVTYWPGGSEELEACALQSADAVVVYGGEETVHSISARITPQARLLVHGPRLSFGIVGREATIAVARDIAAATAAYDQQGCVSPHVVYVEAGAAFDAATLARAVANELELLAGSQPRRRLSHAEVIAIREARARAEFRAIAGANVGLFGPQDTSYTVIYDAETKLPVSCLNRTLYVMPVADAEAVTAIVAPHKHVLQSAAIAGISGVRLHDLARRLALCGVTRLTSFGMLPWPPMWWHHDGRGPLNELLTWHDLEA